MTAEKNSEFTYVLNECKPNQDNTFVKSVLRTTRMIDIITYINMKSKEYTDRISITFDKRETAYNSCANQIVDVNGLPYQEYDVFVTTKQDVNGHIKQKYIVSVFMEKDEYNDGECKPETEL